MRSKIYFLIVTLFISVCGYSQLLIQDGEGKSSIKQKGFSVGSDITKASISINYLGSLYTSKNNNWDMILGGEVSGKNKSGIANIFKKGAFVPEANLSLTYGWEYNQYHYAVKESKAKVESLVKELDEATKKTYDEREAIRVLRDTLYKIVDSSSVLSNSIKIEVKNEITETKTADEVKKVVKGYQNRKDFDEVFDNLMIHIEKYFEDKNTFSTTRITRIRQIQKEIDDLTYVDKKVGKGKKRQVISFSLLPYVSFGYDVYGFKYDLGVVNQPFETRFVDTTSHEFMSKIGLSARYGNFFIGSSVGYSNLGNFKSLDDKDYSFESIDTNVSDGIIKYKEDFTGYSGKFDKFQKLFIELDFLYLFPIYSSPQRKQVFKKPNEAKMYFALGGYFRTNFNSNQSVQLNNSSLGLSFNFIAGQTGKFIGGFYFEHNDLIDQDSKPFSKGFTIGITTKFALFEFGK